MRRPLLALAVVLLAVPALPPGASQTAASSPFVPLYDDAFEADFGWTRANATATSACSTGQPVPAGQTCWFRVADGVVNNLPRMTWYAARLDAAGKPAGYSNDVDANADGIGDSPADATLTSREIIIPEGTSMRSVRVVLKGSSEAGADILRLQWAPGAPDIANQWETLQEWSGGDLASSYRLIEASSSGLRAAQGAITVRFVFDASPTCDSNPGEPGPGIAGLPPPEDVIIVNEPDPDAIVADPPGPAPVEPGPYDPTTDPPGPQGGEAEDLATCRDMEPTSDGSLNDGFGANYAFTGWFIDHLQVVGRRDFVAAAGPSAGRVPVAAHGTGEAFTDLIADMGKVLEFTLDETRTGGGPFSSMAVVLSRGTTDSMTLPLQRSGSTWSGLLAVNEPDLVAGDWVVRFVGIAGNGATILAARRDLDVQAQDVVPPAVTVAPVPGAGGLVRLGPGDDLMLTVLDPLLRRVTYSFPGLPTPLELTYPFVLPEPALPEGQSNLTILATDRAGLSTTRDLKVDRDTVAPVLALNASAVVYAGVPFDLAFQVTERSAHVLRIDINGTTAEYPFTLGQAASGRTTTLRAIPPGVGPITVTALVNDTMGNEARLVRQFTAVPPVTDLRVASLLVETPATNTAREGQVIAATLQQVGGVAPLPVSVVFEASRNTYVVPAIVPATGNLVVRWNATLPPGLHDVRVRIVSPAVLNETHPGNEELSTPLEVFLGRVTVDGQVYAIRSDTRGLPTSVLVVGTSRTLPLDLVDNEGGVAYRFTAANNRTVDWDPLEPVTTLEDTPKPEAKKDAPLPGLLVALAALALAFASRRRR